MSNMSYCRFENTYRDLEDCALALEDVLVGDEKLSERETGFAVQLLQSAIGLINIVMEHSEYSMEQLDEMTESQLRSVLEQLMKSAES